MARKLIAFWLASLFFTVSGVYAETAPSKANLVDANSIQALKEMGGYLQTLQRFQATLDLSSETVLEDGEKLQQSATAEIQVKRPNKLRAIMTSARATRDLIYDGKTVTLFTPALKYYATTEAADNILGMIHQMEDKYGVQIPLEDLFIWGTPNAPIDQIESAMNAGQDFIGQDLCNHYAFRQGKIDWQIWISAGTHPLPRKIVITNRSDEARPQSISLLSWNLAPTFADAVFKFIPPKGASSIGIRPVDAK